MIKKILVKAAAAALAVGMLSFFSCSDSLNENNNMAYLLASKTAEESVQYGSITISTADSRALDVSTITSATVTVSGYGMTDVQGTNVNLSNGSGSATISNIPVGNNRVVTVKSNVDGAVIRGVCNVEAKDNNACTVNWASTAIANVYYYLIKANADVSSIESSSFSSKIPSVHASLFNAEQFAADFKAASFSASRLTANDYVLGYGNIKVNYTNANGYTVQVTDIASEKTTFTTASGNTTLKGYPGEWKVKVYDASGTLKETKDVVVAANKDTIVTINHVSGGTPVTGKIIVHVPSSLGYTCIWAWATSGSTNYTGGNWPGKTMTLNGSYYDYTIEQTACKVIFNDNNKGNTVGTNQTNNLWVTEGEWNYIGGKSGTSDTSGSKISSNFEAATVEESLTVTVENPQVPVAPTATITPDSDTISVSGAITVKLTNGNDTISAASVTVSGAASKTYSYSDFSNDVLTINVSDLGITEADKTITVNASVTNSVKTVTATPKTYKTIANVVAKNTFTWDNVNCYFVLTDRFYNGDTKNDGSYGRVKTSDGVASFHGGDIKGLTEKLDYFNDLGVNAIWISAPYEQTHGWTSGANNGFAHYAFHGYYTQDWTFMDQAMGTIEEFRTFVNEAHKRGIRVVMDIVMNHTGYDNWQDMIDYGFGGFKDSYSRYNHTAFATDGKWTKGDGSSWGTNWDTQDGWFKWWSFWVRGFSDKSWPKDDGVGYWTPAANVDTDPLKGSLQGLPDVVTEKTDTVNLPTFLKTKWYGGSNAVTGGTTVGEVDNTTSVAYGNETGNKYKDYQLPPVSNVDWYNKSGDWRTDGKGAQSDYQVIWLSAWVREFGVDGFRCDTAKHVDLFRWGQLKDACESALAKWRADSTKADTAGAKEWKDKFWMVGEAWGHGSGTSDSYFSTGKFDSMINFSFQGSNNTFGSTSCGTIPQPTDNDGKNWINYANIGASTTDTDSNGNCNSTLSYLSSHDTGLLRHGNMKEVGTKFILLPAGIQIYYGDESWRPYAYNSCGDSDMMTRGDMNWGSNTDSVTHWGKLGKFRKFNPAVGAGSQTTSGSTYIRKFTKTKLSGIEANTIAISLSSTTLSGLPYSNGTTVYNWYDGKSATVQNGSVTFSGSSASTTAPVLCSDRNPADYGVTF